MMEFEALVDKYQLLFNCLDDVDQHMRIIEPDHPKRSDTYRKIALGHHCSLYIDFGPNYTVGKPSHIRFFGSLSRVQDLKQKWKAYEWQKEDAMHDNLLRVFSIQSEQDQDDYTNTNDLECGICYNYKLDNGALPSVVCANTQCNRGFHSHCLYEVI